MTVVQRAGTWRLEERREGVYDVRKLGDLRARIVTDDYEPGLVDPARMDLAIPTITVRDDVAARREFLRYVEAADRDDES